MSDTTSENAFIETLAMRVRELREKSGLSSAEVARRMLMDRGNYSRIETGKTNPTSITLYRLSQIINCEVADFFK
ncbi:helix-turn-helix transcriptional regulator [Ekhidna sp.]|uniref:helix-turn-helix domain-containing protein n=1 Tax=Ekhidna sp. TaxID=2608089 RepID=UPI00329897F1